MKLSKPIREILHYILVYGVLLASWVPLMDYFGDVKFTALFGFIIFVVSDMIAHDMLKI